MKLVATTNLRKTQLAFTMIDAVVGMGVLGIVLLSLFASFSFGFGVIQNSQEELRATQILQEKMEIIRLYKWTQLTTPGFVLTNFNEPLVSKGSNYFGGTISIKNTTNAPSVYNTNLREVVVTLKWTNNIKGTNKVVRSRTTRSFVSRYGLQNYIP